MADLVIDYGLLHQLAMNARSLRENLDITVPRGGGSRHSAAAENRGAGYLSGSGRADVLAHDGPDGVTHLTSSAVGDPGLFGQLTTFYTAWDRPFHDSMDRLEELANLLDSVAKAFFDLDADLAGKANHTFLGFKTAQWEGDKAEYERYLKLRDMSVTHQYYDANGNLVTETTPLWDPNTPPPEKPGDAPTSWSQYGTDVSRTLNPDGTTNTETTTVAGDGLNYDQTKTFTYGSDTDGDGKPNVVKSVTTTTHSDGSVETTTQVNNPDGTSVITNATPGGTSTTTVTPTGTGDGYRAITVDHEAKTTTVEVIDNGDGTPDTRTITGPDSVEVFTGDASADSWTKVSDSPVDDPPAGHRPEESPRPSGGSHLGGGNRQI